MCYMGIKLALNVVEEHPPRYNVLDVFKQATLTPLGRLHPRVSSENTHHFKLSILSKRQRMHFSDRC